MALWYAKDRMRSGPVFGNMDYFYGLAVIIDTYSNHNGEHNVSIYLYTYMHTNVVGVALAQSRITDVYLLLYENMFMIHLFFNINHFLLYKSKVYPLKKVMARSCHIDVTRRSYDVGDGVAVIARAVCT